MSRIEPSLPSNARGSTSHGYQSVDAHEIARRLPAIIFIDLREGCGQFGCLLRLSSCMSSSHLPLARRTDLRFACLLSRIFFHRFTDRSRPSADRAGQRPRSMRPLTVAAPPRRRDFARHYALSARPRRADAVVIRQRKTATIEPTKKLVEFTAVAHHVSTPTRHHVCREASS